MPRIVVFGDSIVWGGYDSKGGWVDRLKQYYMSSIDPFKRLGNVVIYNLGVASATSEWFSENFSDLVKERQHPKHKTITILMLGLNDARFNTAENSFVVSIDDFRMQMERFVTDALKLESGIMLVSPTPVDESKVNPIPWDPEHRYRNSDISQFRDVLGEIAEETGAIFVDVFKPLLELEEPIWVDGVHLTDQGHKKIFELVKPELDRLVLVDS